MRRPGHRRSRGPMTAEAKAKAKATKAAKLAAAKKKKDEDTARAKTPATGKDTKLKRAAPAPPDQKDLFPELTKPIPAIEKAARATVDTQNQRMAWGAKEKDARATLQHALTEHGFTATKGYRRGPVDAWLDVESVKAKARVKDIDTGTDTK